VDLLDHFKKRHAGFVWTAALLNGTGLVACPCGVATKNAGGLRAHQGKAKCQGWANKDVNSAPQLLPARVRSFAYVPPVRARPVPRVLVPATPSPPSSLARPAPSRRVSFSVSPRSASRPVGARTRRNSESAPPSPAPAASPVSSSHGSDGEGILESLFRDQFLKLASLPTANKPLFSGNARFFAATAERLASSYLSNPSEATLFDFLCLPKVGLVPGLKADISLKDQLAAFPNVPWPEPSSERGIRKASTLAEVVARQVETGHLSRAARLLSGASSVLDLTDDVVTELKAKHPVGEASPFATAAGPSPGMVPEEDIIPAVFATFKSDTAPGISGWTQPLLAVALRRGPVLKMVHMLVGQVAQGTAPGQQLLCASRLTPLAKSGGGVRPIAVGELLYRLIGKVLLKQYFKADMLLPCQFGVGSKGGVEPIARLVQRALDKDLPQVFSHLTSLDFSNAFNTINRRDLAQGLKEFAPSLYRAGRWIYGSASKLVVTGGDGKVEWLESSQGVRQGDPLGPLFFCLSIRRTLTDLIQHLGPDHLVVAYLDDTYALSKGEGTLVNIRDWWEERGSSVRLNAGKSVEVGLDAVRDGGMKVLGTAVGSSAFRSDFLERKVDQQLALLDKLPDLPSQHALLLVRMCLQQDLRHLQRSLKTDDLAGCWDRLDERLVRAVLLLRSSPRQLDTDKDLITLPTRLGGMGVLSHSECAPLAYAASVESSDVALCPVLGLLVDESMEVLSQRARCIKMFDTRQSALLSRLTIREQDSVVEASSALGRRWLSVVPFTKNLVLSDSEISAGLHFRTLCPGRDDQCRSCASPNAFGHDEVCDGRPPWTLARHEQVKRLLITTLSAAPDLRVDAEPVVPGSSDRTDFRVTGPSGVREFDLTVVSLSTVAARRASEAPHARQDSTSLERASASVSAILSVAASAKVAKYAHRIPYSFSPFVVSIGGSLDGAALKALQDWRTSLSPASMDWLMCRLSLVLLKARAHSWAF